MANRRAFKSDISFLEKISMGAVGTVTVLNDMKEKGHSPIELERGSTSFKIWKNIKIKRIRVPDILCLDCGKCVECRTKKNLKSRCLIRERIRSAGGTTGLMTAIV